jgi:hypothetical protein
LRVLHLLVPIALRYGAVLTGLAYAGGRDDSIRTERRDRGSRKLTSPAIEARNALASSTIGGEREMNPTSTEAPSEAPETIRSRRGFLRDLTLGSVIAAAAVTAIVPAAGATEAVSTNRQGAVKVFRFSTRNPVSCRACRLHHRYMVFRSRKVARKNRAHPRDATVRSCRSGSSARRSACCSR